MRFVVQYFSRADDRWYRLAAGGDSGYLSIGKGRKPRAVRPLAADRAAPPASRCCCAAGSTSSGALKGDVVRSASALTRKGHRSNTGDDPEGYSASTCTITSTEPLGASYAGPNSRGSLEITPVTPQRSSSAIRCRVVDGPGVELAAGGADRGGQARRDEPVVRHERVDLAAADAVGGDARQRAPHVRQDGQRGQHRDRVGERVAAHPRQRPAQAQLGMAGAQERQRGVLHRRDERALAQAVVAQRGGDALLVAAGLHVDDELDAVVDGVGEVREPLLEGVRAGARRRPPSRGRAAARRCRRDARAGRRTRSCRRRARARRRRTRTCCRARCGRRPCARRGASRPAPAAVAALTTGIPSHQYVSRLSSPWPRLRIGAPQRGQGRPAFAVHDAVQVLHPVQRGLLHPRARRADDRQRLVVADRARRPPRVDRAPRSSPRTSTGCRSPRSCAGRAARRRSRASGRRRAGARGTPARRARARGCPARASPGAGRSACATRSAARAPARRTGRPRPSCVRSTSQARRCARRQRWPSRYVPQEPVMRRCEWIARSPSKCTKRCLPCASTRVTARPASFSGQRSPRRRGLGCAISGTRPYDERADPARGVVDRVALGHGFVQSRAGDALDERPSTRSGAIVGAPHVERGVRVGDLALPGVPATLVRPGDAQEVAAVVAWCYAHDVAIVPVGGRSGLAGGAAVVDTGAGRSRCRSSGCGPCARSSPSCGGWRPRPA